MSHFTGVDDVVEAVREAEPDTSRVEPAIEGAHQGRTAAWVVNSPYIVSVDADKIRLTEGNPWNFVHAAGVAEAMRSGGAFEPPAGRVYRVTADDVKRSQKYEPESEDLEYNEGLARPWTKRDVGAYYAQLLDGNHRAVAAMAIGESAIPIVVGPNYRENVRKKDWLVEKKMKAGDGCPERGCARRRGHAGACRDETGVAPAAWRQSRENPGPGPVPPESLDVALAWVAAGGRLAVPTAYKVLVITQKDIAAWDKAGKPLLRERDNGYQLRQRKGSVYLLPGQLRMVE